MRSEPGSSLRTDLGVRRVIPPDVRDRRLVTEVADPPRGLDELIHSEISRVGQEGISRLSVIDSQTDALATLVIAWQCVAAAVVVDSTGHHGERAATGQYA